MQLDSLLKQEKKLQLPNFSHEDAWLLGNHIKNIAETEQSMIAIEVYGFGQLLFFYAMPNTHPDNIEWLRRKRNTVLRFGHSSYYCGLYNQHKQRIFEEQMHINAENYCGHGGSFPLRLIDSGIIGCVSVSGLDQVKDHQIAAGAIECLANNKMV